LADRGVEEITTRADLTGKGSGYALEALEMAYSLSTAETLAELMARIAREP
jgi:hypothetical protein